MNRLRGRPCQTTLTPTSDGADAATGQDLLAGGPIALKLKALHKE
jgi:hypothetical protein